MRKWYIGFEYYPLFIGQSVLDSIIHTNENDEDLDIEEIVKELKSKHSKELIIVSIFELKGKI